ncbi:hypothetical protein HK100_002247 [Physocladia obscura]|uniref:C2H2-type domain-containing protein n=1 Tax=Physocladia obscura TaxID=109957 RepID=A0AAD5XB87_9FUNG|nr:hypothetical protein HK100_002247 [Physocladia obscura]
MRNQSTNNPDERCETQKSVCSWTLRNHFPERQPPHSFFGAGGVDLVNSSESGEIEMQTEEKTTTAIEHSSGNYLPPRSPFGSQSINLQDAQLFQKPTSPVTIARQHEYNKPPPILSLLPLPWSSGPELQAITTNHGPPANFQPIVSSYLHSPDDMYIGPVRRHSPNDFESLKFEHYENVTSRTSVLPPRYSFYLDAPEPGIAATTRQAIRFPTPPHHASAKPPPSSSSVQQQQICCTSCSQKFGRRQDLMRHLRVTHSVFFCEDCKQQFSSVTQVNTHLDSGKCENAKGVRRRGRPPLMPTVAVRDGDGTEKREFW